MASESRDVLGSAAERAAIDRTLPGILEVLSDAGGPLTSSKVMEGLTERGFDPDDMHMAAWTGITSGKLVLSPDTHLLELPDSPLPLE